MGHPTASTRATSPPNPLDAFFLEEDSCAYLARFETVVLVDDSSLMFGPRWQLASDLLADMSKVVTEFDPNGFRLHFSHHTENDLKHATTPELIRKMFAIVEPAKLVLPIYEFLERELTGYTSMYLSNSKLRGLNLLVLTDSGLDNWDPVLEVISQASEQLKKLGAGKENTSIQFINIGPGEELPAFLGRLEAYTVGLQPDHIVVDRIPWNPEEKHPLLETVLFGGIRGHWDDQAYEYVNATRPFNEDLLNTLRSSEFAERRIYQRETASIRQVLLVALTNCLPRTVLQEKYYRINFDLTWELLAFVRDHLGESEKLSQVITLTGTQVNAQASTCEQYIREFWPNTGPQVLSSIDDFCDQCLRQREVSMVTMFPKAGSLYVGGVIQVESEKTIIGVLGPLEWQIEVTEILAWLTAAVRSSTPPSLSSSEASLTFENYESDSEVAYFKLQPKALNSIRYGSTMCWHPLFEHSAIAAQFPYAPRTQGVGVELSPLLMATLAGIQTAVEFRGGLILRGLSTALIPLGMREDEDAIQWHLATTKRRDDAIITELFGGLDEIEGIDAYYKVQDIQQLLDKRAYLGWSSVATVRLGTQEASYQEVTWSDSSKIRRHIEFSGFSLSLGSSGQGFGGPTGTANFLIPKAQRTHFMDVENQLKDRLKYSIARPVIVYDTLDQRGWMLPIVCLMLYMMHLRVQKVPKPPGASRDGLAPMPYSRVDREAAYEAYEILTEYMEPGSASALGNSEDWTDTLTLFYIALDTFFSKSKELSSSSSDISGFELMDVVLAEKPFRYNSRHIQRNSGGWAQLGETIGILFCKGIGDAIVPGPGANVLCRPWSNVPSGFNYLAAYVPCVIEVLSRQGKHKGSERLRQRIGYDLYHTCHHAGKSRCSHLQTYHQIADPPDDPKNSISQVTRDEETPSAENLISHRGAIIFGKKTTLVKSWLGV